MHGHAGFEHAHAALMKAHAHMTGGHSNTNLTMKYDGSPSIVFGHHPDTGKFFVASKSAFNVKPKINYTHNDIAKNHGHAPGLMDKLHSSLNHLPKITPKTGVYQGDLMYSEGDKKEKDGKVSLVGFGTFSVAERAARQGINPATKKPINIEAKTVAKFKAGKELSAKL